MPRAHEAFRVILNPVRAGEGAGGEVVGAGAEYRRARCTEPPVRRPHLHDLDMSPLMVFTLAIVALGSTQEVKRNNRIRFPNEPNSQYQNGPHLIESESQAVPIIITAGGNGLVNAPHYILSKNPSPASPFGQIGTKGYAEGVIIPHTPFHTAQNQEFHQTVPPPIRIPYGLPQSFVMYRQEQSNQQARPNSHQQQQPERHRFGLPRPHFPYSQLKQMHPNKHAHHEIFASGMAVTKDAQKNPDVSMYRYSIVTNHGKPRPSHPDEFEMEINHGIPEEPFPQMKPKPHHQQTNNFNKPKIPQQKPQNLPKAQDTSSFPDFEQEIPNWQIKGGSFQDTLSNSNGFQDKKKKGSKPNVDNFPLFDNNEDFSGFDDFDFSSFPNENNKRFSSQQKPDFERGKTKPLFKPTRETFINDSKNKKKSQKQTPSFETIKSIELVGGELFSDENISPNFDGFKQKPFKKQEKPQTNFNSNRFPQKSQLKKPQKPQNSHEIKYPFNYPQRPERQQKKPQKQFSNENFDFSFDFPNQKPLKKQYKQHLIQQQLPPINYNFEFDLPKAQQNKENHHSSNSGSDWIPINAPEGVVPARSYEIPAPDLSRGVYEDKHTFGRDWEAERNNDDDDVEDENNFRFSSSETVYGVQKGGGHSGHHPGEEVVSATFRVKQ